MRFEFYVNWSGWYWRLRAKNGRIVADGAEDYSTRSNVRRAIKRHQSALGLSLPIVEVLS